MQNAKRALEQDPTDASGTIKRTLIVSLIKTKAFEEALQIIKSHKGKEFAFEHAYILHRMGQNS